MVDGEGQVGGKRAGRARGRVADASRRHPDDTEADIPGAPQAQDIGEKVARSLSVVRAEEPEPRLRPPKKRQAGSESSQGGKANGLTVLSAQVRACHHGCVPEECRQPTGRPLLVVRPG